MDFSIGALRALLPSSLSTGRVATVLITAREKTVQMLPEYIKSALTPQEGTPPTLLYRVSVSIYNDPLQAGVLIVIVLQVKVIAFNVLFGVILIRDVLYLIIFMCLPSVFRTIDTLRQEIANLTSMANQLQELKTTHNELKSTFDTEVAALKARNTDLQTTNANLDKKVGTLENTNTDLKATNTDLKATNTDLKATNTDLKATNTDLQATKDGFEEQLAELTSATTSLLSSISRVAEDREATVDDIQQFKEVADIFIGVVQGNQNAWGDVTRQLHEAKLAIHENSAILDERQRQLAHTTQQLTSVQGLLATTTHNLAGQLGMAADRVDGVNLQLGMAADRVDEMSQPQQLEHLVRNIVATLLLPNRTSRSQQHSPQGERSRESITSLVES